MQKQVNVSIGLPVFNGANYLAKAISSLQEQTFADFELIVSDNASSDETEEIVRSFAASDSRIRYYRNERNLGANPNYNRVFTLAKGSFFRWHAHDDVCGPKYLERCYGAMQGDPSAVLVHTQTAYIDRNDDPLVKLAHGFVDPDGFVERLETDDHAPTMLASPVAHVRLDGVVNRMSVFFDVFGLMRTVDMRQTLLLQNFYGADKVFLAEMALRGRLIRLPENGFARRCHPEASTRSTSFKELAGWSDASRSNDFYPALILRGYVAAVLAANLPAREKARCLAVVAKRCAHPYRLFRGR